ncbi:MULTISPECIES: DEAD/DEAH box helicase [unclassified Lentimonas]|nr:MULTISPECIES: DEAD/DEAH box helicase [unclassified Lentimonas]
MLFSELGLRPELVAAVEAKGYTTPSPIQARAIPAILEGRDVLGGAQTGTGKTAAFSLPVLQRLASGEFKGQNKRARVLVLAPTRELAAQVHQSIVDYGQGLNMRSFVIFGGVGFQPQINAIRRGLDIIVATPGRLLDLCQRGDLQLSGIEVLILDEADRMLDMGFINDIKKILQLMPSQRQNLFFSATYTKEVKKLADSMLNNPVEVEVAARNATADRVDQEAYVVGQKAKSKFLAEMIKDGDWNQVLVFTRTKHGANRLATDLDKQGIGAMAIHGNKSQSARERALAAFKSNKIRVLVATDIAARGIDIADLPHVVNFELPNIPEDYVHRIGRTARAGKAGNAVSLVSDVEEGYLWDIEKTMKKNIPLFKIDDRGEKIEMPRPATRSKLSRPAPGQQKRGGGGGGRGRQGGGGGRSGGGKGRPQGGGRSGGGRPQGGGRSGGGRPQGGGGGGRPQGGSSGGGSPRSAAPSGAAPTRSRGRNR